MEWLVESSLRLKLTLLLGYSSCLVVVASSLIFYYIWKTMSSPCYFIRVPLDQTDWFMSMALAGIALFPGSCSSPLTEWSKPLRREMHLVFWYVLIGAICWILAYAGKIKRLQITILQKSGHTWPSGWNWTKNITRYWGDEYMAINSMPLNKFHLHGIWVLPYNSGMWWFLWI